MNHIIAAIYQGINQRVKKNDTPYFNTLMLLFWAVALLVIQILLILELSGIKFLSNISKQFFLILFIGLAIVVVLLFGSIFPKDKIISIEVPKKDVNKYYYSMIIYFVISISILMFLLVNVKHK